MLKLFLVAPFLLVLTFSLPLFLLERSFFGHEPARYVDCGGKLASGRRYMPERFVDTCPPPSFFLPSEFCTTNLLSPLCSARLRSTTCAQTEESSRSRPHPATGLRRGLGSDDHRLFVQYRESLCAVPTRKGLFEPLYPFPMAF